VLSASLNDTRKSITFQNKIPNEYQNVLLFYKNQKSDVNANRSDLGMLTLEGGIVKSIYNSISSIFVPSAMNVSYSIIQRRNKFYSAYVNLCLI
jgi:dynein heavy chain 2